MDYTYDPIFAKDEANPNLVAQNASITIFDPSDPAKAPIAITDVTGSPLPNPITVNDAGMGPAFRSALDRVGWFGAGFMNFFTSYEGMRAVAQGAKEAAQAAAANAAAAATEALDESKSAADAAATSALGAASNAAGALAAAQAAQAAAEAAAAASSGGGVAIKPADPDVLIVSTKDDGTVALKPSDPDVLTITT